MENLGEADKTAGEQNEGQYGKNHHNRSPSCPWLLRSNPKRHHNRPAYPQGLKEMF